MTEPNIYDGYFPTGEDEVTTEAPEKKYVFKKRAPDWFRPTPNGLTEEEYIMLAKLVFHGGMHEKHPDENKQPTDLGKIHLRSLVRFRYAETADLYPENSQYPVSVMAGWMPTEEGIEYMKKQFRPSTGCACEHAIRLGCVCREKTYCPNPEHFDRGNGCHGSHD